MLAGKEAKTFFERFFKNLPSLTKGSWSVSSRFIPSLWPVENNLMCTEIDMGFSRQWQSHGNNNGPNGVKYPHILAPFWFKMTHCAHCRNFIAKQKQSWKKVRAESEGKLLYIQNKSFLGVIICYYYEVNKQLHKYFF